MSTLFHGPSERFLATVYVNIRCIQSAGPGAVIILFQKRIQHPCRTQQQPSDDSLFYDTELVRARGRIWPKVY